MITFAPLPRWKDLLKLLIPKKIDDEKLSAPWRRDGDKIVWFSRTAWSLQTIIVWWENVFPKKTPCVWLPGYFCNQSLWPLRQTSARIVFYPILEDLTPDWEACERLALEKKPDIFILTHFYGLVSDVEFTHKFCTKYKSIMVEDAAHMLVPTQEVGKFCHFILYSPHKMFSLPHGALCVIRPSLTRYIHTMNAEGKDFKDISNVNKYQSPLVIVWIIKKVIQKIMGNYISKNKKIKSYEEDGTSSFMAPNKKMSYASKKLLYFMLTEIPGYIHHRQECAKIWDDLLKENKVAVDRVFSTKYDIPYVAVYSSVNNDAQQIYYDLSKKKWPVSSWPDLPPEIRASPNQHPSTIHFRNNMLIFPVHQTLNFLELIKYYKTLK